MCGVTPASLGKERRKVCSTPDQGGSGFHTWCYRNPFPSILMDTVEFPCIVSYVFLTLLTAFVSTTDSV